MEAIFHIGIAQSLFAAFVLFTKKDSSFPDRILGTWMIFIGAELLHMLFDIQGNPLFRITSNYSFFSLTFGPFLFLYAIKLLDKSPILTWKDTSHFYPYIIFAMIHLVFFTNQPMRANEIDDSGSFFILTGIRLICLFFSLIVYSSVVIWIIIKHQKEYKKTFSYESSRITLNWIRFITVIFVMTYLTLSLIFLFNLMNQEILETSHIIPGVGLTVISFSVSYFGFRQPSLFMSSETQMQLDHSHERMISAADRKSLEIRIRNFMIDRKPYLDPELTIQKFADMMDIPRTHVSLIINQNMNKNFFNFINEYRVEEAKDRLTDPKYENKTVLAVGYDSGFNSKSSFNALFKEITDMTPSEYRKKYYIQV